MPKINLEQLNAIVDRATKGAVVKAPVYIRKIGATTEANKSAKLDRTQLQAIIKDAVQKAWAEKKVADNTPSPVSLQEVNNTLLARSLQPIKPERTPTRAEVRAETGPGVHDEVTQFVGVARAQRKLVRPKA